MKLRGVGVVTRHSKNCALARKTAGAVCTCTPSYEAWIYEHSRRRKRRRTFHDRSEALLWRVTELRRMYGVAAETDGKIDRAYSLLRRTSQELDRVLSGEMPRRQRALIREALDALYSAEDAVLTSMRELVP